MNFTLCCFQDMEHVRELRQTVEQWNGLLPSRKSTHVYGYLHVLHCNSDSMPLWAKSALTIKALTHRWLTWMQQSLLFGIFGTQLRRYISNGQTFLLCVKCWRIEGNVCVTKHWIILINYVSQKCDCWW